MGALEALLILDLCVLSSRYKKNFIVNTIHTYISVYIYICICVCVCIDVALKYTYIYIDTLNTVCCSILLTV